MKRSEIFIPTLKEEPADAVAVSHKLMIRAGLIRKFGTGLYGYLPLGLRVFKKVENIIREEMNRAGAQEFSPPILTPAELWEMTGRWEEFGPEMIRIRDRSEHWYALGPTHEELFTYIVKMEITSYKDLPVNFYQIKTKFRDEIRPRYGVMRCREFTMKDAYSFDIDEQGLEVSYQKMKQAYQNIFKKCGLNTVIIEAEPGVMGGSRSEEFMVISDIGEEVMVLCENCSYATSYEKAEYTIKEKQNEEVELPLEEIDTPDVRTIDELVNFLNIPPAKFIKTLIYMVKDEPVMILVQGNREVNEIKLMKYFKTNNIKLAESEIIEQVTGAPVGFAGPVGLKEKVKIIADFTIEGIRNGITGANKKDKHLKNVNYKRDFEVDDFADLTYPVEGDLCPQCGGRLIFKKGIEVGHIFKLGDKYTKSMNVTVLNKGNREVYPLMGCYGIGVDRTIAAIVEVWNDKDGIIWPVTVAPFEIIVLPINWNDTEVKEISMKIYETLKEEFEVLLDDRADVSPGYKFKDADLIGIPIKIIIGKKALNEGKVEIKIRRTQESILSGIADIKTKVKEILLQERKKVCGF